MSIVFPTPGQEPWDSVLDRLLSQIGANPCPDEHGFETWTYDPAMAAGSSATTSGRLYLARMPVRMTPPGQVTRLGWIITGAGASPVAGQNLVGVYGPDGTLLSSAVVDGDIATTGAKSTPLPAFALPGAGGFVWAAFLFNATTPPTLASGPATGPATINIGLAAEGLRFATAGEGLTALPAAVVPANNTVPDAISAFAALGL